MAGQGHHCGDSPSGASSQLPGSQEHLLQTFSNHSQKTGICFALILKEVESLFQIIQLSNFKGREEIACATILLYSLPVICGVASAPGVRE